MPFKNRAVISAYIASGLEPHRRVVIDGTRPYTTQWTGIFLYPEGMADYPAGFTVAPNLKTGERPGSLTVNDGGDPPVSPPELLLSSPQQNPAPTATQCNLILRGQLPSGAGTVQALLNASGGLIQLGSDQFAAIATDSNIGPSPAAAGTTTTLTADQLLVGSPTPSDILRRATYVPGIKTTAGAVNLGTAGTIRQTGQYVKVGKNVWGTMAFQCGTAGVTAAGAGARLLVQLPSTPDTSYGNQAIGSVFHYANGTGVHTPGTLRVTGVDNDYCDMIALAGVPFSETAIAASNQLTVEFSYLEAGSSAAGPVVAGVDVFQRAAPKYVTTSPFTITHETALGIGVAGGVVNFPPAAQNVGQMVTVYALAGDITLNAYAGDIFVLSSSASQVVPNGTVIQFVAVVPPLAPAAGWVAMVRSGFQFELPPWLGVGLATGKLVRYNGTQPNWDFARAEEVTYTPGDGTDWVNPLPTSPAQAIDRMAKAIRTAHGPIP